MGVCVSYNYDEDEIQSKYVCGVCNKELSVRYLECSYCNKYSHYTCGKASNNSLERCIICDRKGGLIKRFNLELDKDRRNTI